MLRSDDGPNRATPLSHALMVLAIVPRWRFISILPLVLTKLVACKCASRRATVVSKRASGGSAAWR